MADKKEIFFNKTPSEVLRDRKVKYELSEEQKAYQERMAELKSAKVPLGGAPPVEIPPLYAEPVEGFKGSISDQAKFLKDPTNPQSPFYDPKLAMNNPKHPLAPIPPQAAKDPNFRPGVGSMYMANQPQIAEKAEQRQYKPELSAETIEGLKALAELQAKAQQIQEKNMDKEKAEEQPKEKDEKSAEDRLRKDFQEMRELLGEQQWNFLTSPARRKQIEGRCKPMDITDIILHGEVRQDVPVRTGDKPLVFTFRSVTAEEDLAVKRMMYGETGGDRYLLDKYAIMNLTLALVAINGELLPSHLTDDGKFDEKRFESKYKKILKFPIQLIAELSIQYQWFDERVRELFLGSTDALKNS